MQVREKEMLKFKWGIVPVFLLPLMLSYTPSGQDSASTVVEFALGKGSYAHVNRGCEGNVISATDVPFEDAAISVERRNPPAKYGIKAGISHFAAEKGEGGFIDTEAKTVYFLNPNFGFNTRYLGADLGLILLNDFPRVDDQDQTHKKYLLSTGEFRVGSLRSWYFFFGVGNNLPLFVTGMGNLGVAARVSRKGSMLRLAIGGFPYDGTVFSLRNDFPVSHRVFLDFSGAVGHRERLEYGFSIGSRIKF